MDIEALLQPISPDNPCGEDLSYDPRFNELETMLRGKEETQFSAAEEPDWKAVRDRCTELFARSKDLRVAVTLILALLKTEGLPGFRDGLRLLQILLRDHWYAIYPRLDPEDNNDPMERINVISGMAKPLGTFGDPLKFLERLRQAPLASSSRIGRFSLADITGIGLPAGEEKAAAESAQVAAAFKDSAQDGLQGLHAAAVEAREVWRELDAHLNETVGSNRAPNLDDLASTLKEIQQVLRPYAPATGEPEAETDAATGDQEFAGAMSSHRVVAAPGAIGSRDDVVAMLEKVCEYYRAAEPGSPVPLLLRRAQRLVHMDFLQLMQELAPDSMSQVGIIVGQGSSAGGGDGYSEESSE